ncbi:GspE/PulE family protein [Coxiella burnetii]|uniref:GspE/PulE family protein n=1 Tax=Coxiella burnetii TaxID=777 RepID=UPI0000ED0262|nr:ATPase, T2SS/T4P/T4SS family [Coxiella burnetii]ACJ21008.1 type 4 pili biogenesis protein (nuleotide-binding protein) [Coxiella burnetii CbuK_Q154]EAX33495.1 type 4 pili biogenesis protein (nuleotide-binding protein) [Coxiella burnetii 'MSU Goat Q177']
MQTKVEGLAHILLQTNALTNSQIARAIEQAAGAQSPLLHYLVTEKIVSSEKIAEACATYFGLEAINLQTQPLNPSLCHEIPRKYLMRYAFISLAVKSPTLAISDPLYFPLIEELQFQTNKQYKIVFAPYKSFAALINNFVSRQIYETVSQGEASIVELVNQVLTDAIYREASDVHFEPMQQHYRIRMRIDGILHTTTLLPNTQSPAMSSRLKVLAELDISEKRLPQDGRFYFTTLTHLKRDCRLSSCPTLFGEKIVIRLLNPVHHLLKFEELGLEEKPKQLIMKKIKQPQGLILVTGPTRSGKTVSLYAALNQINSTQKNISTVEDPIEIQLAGVTQVNIRPKAGLNFAAVLRAFLRQDPDVIMVGEIRDFETASIAVRAAHTGHLVLSTLHTNSAVECITRLIDMGIEPFNLASVLKLVVAQRLVRQLCAHCQATKISCPFCLNRYQGRTGMYEVLPITPSIIELILQKRSAQEINACAIQEGMQTLWQAALNKAKTGITNLNEIYRVIQSENNYA